MKVGKQSLRRGVWVACAANRPAAGGGGGGRGGGGGGGGGQGTGTAALAQQCSAFSPYRADARQQLPPRPARWRPRRRAGCAPTGSAISGTAEVPVVDASAAAYSNDTMTGFYTSIDGYFQRP